jgi:hypothetical protein
MSTALRSIVTAAREPLRVAVDRAAGKPGSLTFQVTVP